MLCKLIKSHVTEKKISKLTDRHIDHNLGQLDSFTLFKEVVLGIHSKAEKSIGVNEAIADTVST